MKTTREDDAAKAVIDPGPLPGQAGLTHLFHLRNFAIVAAISAILVATRYYHVELPVPELLRGVGAMAIFNLYTWYRLRLARPVTEAEFSRHLAVDLQVLSVMLYLSGGDDNPFGSLFFVPLTIAAAYLKAPYSVLLILVAALDYGLLNLQYVPLAMADGTSVPDSVRGVAVDVSYLLTGTIIAFFVTRLAATARTSAASLAAAREQQLNDRFVVGFGTLAAGAVHEMATPLSVIAVLVKELKAGRGNVMEVLETVGRQVEACIQTLRHLSEAAGQQGAETAHEVPLEQFLESIAGRFRTVRPDATLQTEWDMPAYVPLVRGDLALAQSLLTLLNNAADASRESVLLKGYLREDMLVLEVADRGSGIPREIANRLGQPFVTTKGPAKGMGMGLFLAKTSIERLGGTLEFLERQGGGTRVSVTLPVIALQT